MNHVWDDLLVEKSVHQKFREVISHLLMNGLSKKAVTGGMDGIMYYLIHGDSKTHALKRNSVAHGSINIAKQK
jgi:hypothetical protein